MVLTIAPVSSVYRTPYKPTGKSGKSSKAKTPQISSEKYCAKKRSIFSTQYGTVGAVLRAHAAVAAAKPHLLTSASNMSHTPTESCASFPFAVNCKLSKVFYSVPKKCSQCNKLLVFTAYACQFCRYRVHRKCANIDESTNALTPSKRRLCSLSKLHADEELFEKLIRENEINSNDMDVFLEECSQLLAHASSHPVQLRHSMSAKAIRSWSGCGMRDFETDSEADSTPRSHRKSVDASLLQSCDGSMSQPAPVMIHRLFQMFSRVQLQAPDKNQSSLPSHIPAPRSTVMPRTQRPTSDTSDEPYSSDSGVFSAPAVPLNRDSLNLRVSAAGGPSSCSSGITTPIRTPVDEFNDTLISEILANHNPAIAESDVMRRRRNWVRYIAGNRAAQSQDCVLDQESTLRSSARPSIDHGHPEGGGASLLDYASGGPAPLNSVSNMLASLEPGSKLCATWPLAGLHMNYEDECIGGDFEDSEFTDEEGGCQRYYDTSSLGISEWTVPFEDVSLAECVFESRNMKTYKGKWHGDVMIHVYDVDTSIDPTRLSKFMSEVHALTKIRHENLALFMGACVQPPKLAVITGAQKGDSLFEAVHLRKRKPFSESTKIQILRQVSQAMGYLHEKGIVLRVLSSKNVYLESKVKVCIVDYGGARTKFERPDRGCLPRGQLCYYSPEIMASLAISPPEIYPTVQQTTQTDVYAFGTVIFELYTCNFPFARVPAESVIYLVGSGNHSDLTLVKDLMPSTMKGLIRACWSPDPAHRPTFMDMYMELNTLVRLTRSASGESSGKQKHSSSVPDRLNRVGQPQKRSWIT